jgi:hypothetical protein
MLTRAPSLMIIGALTLLADCSGSRRTDETVFKDAPGAFVRAGAPHPFGCTTDADCVGGPLVNPQDGCCDTGVPQRVFSRAYLVWRRAWVAHHCAEVRCPVLPSPSLPLPCAVEGRCLGGRCVDRCSAHTR